jgi:hypothetical protein
VVETGIEEDLVAGRALDEQHARELIGSAGQQRADPVLAPQALAVDDLEIAAVVGVDGPVPASGELVKQRALACPGHPGDQHALHVPALPGWPLRG